MYCDVNQSCLKNRVISTSTKQKKKGLINFDCRDSHVKQNTIIQAICNKTAQMKFVPGGEITAEQATSTGYTTYAQVWMDTRRNLKPFGYGTSGDGLHAEIEAINAIKEAIDNGIFEGCTELKFVMWVSKSPCPSCGTVITNFNDSVYKNIIIKLEILPDHPYHGGGGVNVSRQTMSTMSAAGVPIWQV